MANCEPNSALNCSEALSMFQLQGQEPISTGIITKEHFFLLKCFGCSGYLSESPVYSAKDGSCNKCHKCYGKNANDSNSYFRNLLYETFAEKLVFPCHRSSECTGTIRWGEQSSHDQTCAYKAITCPYPGCGVSIEMFQIYSHFQGAHTVSIANPVTIRILANNWDLVAFRHGGRLYLIHYKTRDGMLWLDVLAVTKRPYPCLFSVIVTDGTRYYAGAEPCVAYFTRNLFDMAAMKLKLPLHSLFPYRNDSSTFDISVQVHSPCAQLHVHTCSLCGMASEWDFRLCGAEIICFSCHQNQVLCPHCGIEFMDKTNYPSTALPFLTMANCVRTASLRKSNAVRVPPPYRTLYNRAEDYTEKATSHNTAV
ncbi:hypothetical protein HUJ04_007894 [Dendroctonus ponderosae]|uniref:SIAH-type domain-containing protein n=1 Tax=Dendroctonus ponderosae TaxID=77166 RepID=A0AAR5PBV1_DENPD|nr:hypothetical protein HUJ04_007894 [Dendroctonus ponderosae]